MIYKDVYIVAEIAQGFEGDIALSKRFVKLAKDCGADAIKFQIFRAEEICTKDYKYYDLFKSLEIQSEKWAAVIEYAKEMRVDFFVDISGVDTFEWISKTPIAGVKVHSTDLKNYRLLNVLRNKKLKIFLAAGGSVPEELEKAISILGENEITIMSGFQAEPNQYKDVELDKIGYLSNRFKLPVGYADHIDANDELASILPSMAVLKGARVIEKHLTIDRNHLQLEDYISALNPEEFKQMVKLIRSVEQFSYTGDQYSLSEREQTYRLNTKKVVLAARSIKAGEKIQADDLIMLRTGRTVPELIDIGEIVGKNCLRDIDAEQVITRNDFK